MNPDQRPTAAELMTGKARPSRAPRIRSDETIGRPEDIGTHPAAKRTKPTPAAAAGTERVRVTLNIPPGLYRQLRKWTDHAADEIGVPDVSQQDALRAMITAVVLDKSIGLVVIDLLRREKMTT